MHASSRAFVAAVLSLLVTGAHAQTPPDAGALLQQMERNRAQVLPKPAKPDFLPLPAPMQGLPGAKVTVRAFRFAGNRLLTESQLAPVVARFLNHPLGFNELQQAASAIGDAYRAAGWIVRAYLPRQSITDGVVTIQVVEAVFGKLELEGGPLKRLKTDLIQRMLGTAVKPGQPIDAEALDRMLLLIDDLAGVSALGSLAEGTGHGETDVVLKVSDEALIEGDLRLDNTGSRSTGAVRGAANVVFNSPLRIADQATADFIHTEGSDYGRLGYLLPLGLAGWRVGGHVSRMDYHVITPEFAALNSRGYSNTAGLDASYPLLRSRLANMYLNLGAEHKHFDNQDAISGVTFYGEDSVSVSLSGNRFDNLLGGGANSASLSVVSGRMDHTGSPVDGSFARLNYSASRQQVITSTLALYGAVSGQVANGNLDSGEKFYLGGSGGVRAYPSSEAGGAEGQLVILELRAKLPQNVDLVGFYDWGRVKVNRDNDFTGGATLNRYGLKGAGLSLGWRAPLGTDLKAVWAHRIGDNPNPTLAGLDQDGSKIMNRFWLSASQPF